MTSREFSDYPGQEGEEPGHRHPGRTQVREKREREGRRGWREGERVKGGGDGQGEREREGGISVRMERGREQGRERE